ncbi:hypothetical protein [Streptomyces alanosinicus]|uniref:Uncharacterized protein n=1 Tax=Streptomyces alanosinicus TaxID=68171 RepID=A0A919D6J7_9ACTN|nr:hypothetical protein [Streptomyces alanosinicus]GHE08999.1 hypothetical protein GCM10010339_59830 [Streptomyces alanosinicus]
MHMDDHLPVDELSLTWDAIREDYHNILNDEYDQAALDCAARLAAEPDGESAYVWTIGLLLMAPYVAWDEGDAAAPGVMAALKAADDALRDHACEHEAHPYQEHEEGYDEYLAEQLRGLADESLDWEENFPREAWRCPRNVAGLARIAMDLVEPGSATDIPPRLPVGAQETIGTLAALLHGYPEAGTDVYEEISYQAMQLRHADEGARPGQLLVVVALSWYVAFEENVELVEDLVTALEKTLPHYAEASCAHDGHALPYSTGPDVADLGITLTTPGGRALYEQRRELGGPDIPLDVLLCPVALTEYAEDSLTRLRARCEELR